MIGSAIVLALMVFSGLVVYRLLGSKADKLQSRQLSNIYRQGKRLMALAQDILDAVNASRAEQDTLSNTVAQLVATVDQIIAAVQTLVESGAITPEQAQTIIGTALADRDAATVANQSAASANQKLQDTLTNLQG